MAVVKIKAIAPWFGGKRTLAPRIVEELGQGRSYWEPFGGSLAVLMRKPIWSMETVNDLHGDITNLARVIADPVRGAKLYRRLRRTLLSQAMFHNSASIINDEPFVEGLERAYHYFVVVWFGRNGVAGSKGNNNGFCVRYTANGGHAAKRFGSAVQSIPAWGKRLRAVTILKMDAFELIERIEDARHAVIYCDPPYLIKGAKYVYDFESGDHDRLAGLLKRFKRTRVVVSYYDDPRLNDLYSEWTKVECHITKSLVSQGKRDKGHSVKAPEVLLINGDSYTDAQGTPLWQPLPADE